MEAKLSQVTRATVYASSKGYKVTPSGDVVSPQGNTLKVQTSGNNLYPKICIWFEGTRVKVSIHRLVAYQKFGDKILQKGVVVRHLDDDPNNFSFENIEIGTPSQNFDDRGEERRRAIAMKSVMTRSTLTKNQHFDMIKSYLQGDTVMNISKRYDMPYSTTSSICKGLYYKEWYSQHSEGVE